MRRQLFDFSNSSMATVFGVAVFGPHNGKAWHRLSVMPAYRIGNRLYRLLWKVRYRLCRKHRYHLIDTGLPPRYYEIDDLMLHGMFALLRRFVVDVSGGIEKLEEGTLRMATSPDPNAPEGLIEASVSHRAEAAGLYRWWTEEHPALVARRNALSKALYGGRITMSAPKNGVCFLDVEKPEGDSVAMRRERSELEARIDREEQDALCRLIGIRHYLW